MPSRANRHAPRKTTATPSGRQPERRGSAASRGYGRGWQAKRAAVLDREPLCRHCRAEGTVTLAKEVDHIIPVSGPGDPRFWQDDNLQPLCKPHHSAKTIRDTAAGLTRKPRGKR